jgi:hypothetical protein
LVSTKSQIQGTPTGSKLENATREDLIKLLKRQQLLLKKSNSENEAAKASLKSTVTSLENKLESCQSSVSLIRIDLVSESSLLNSNKYQQMRTVSLMPAQSDLIILR